MKVERSRKASKPRKSGNRRMRVHSRRRPMDQIHKLRIWMLVLAILATCAIGGAIYYFWHQFSEPFRLAEERNATSVSSQSYDNHTEFPIYADSFNLVLVNFEHKLSDDFTVNLTQVKGVAVEERIAVYLEAMLQAAKEDGIDLQVESGYVSEEEQQMRYEETVQTLLDQGLSRLKAEDQAKRTVGAGGYSEYQTGMAVNFGTSENAADFSQTKAYRWLQKNSMNYGFVLRYPANKTDYTQMEFDPSHFRFVGIKHAKRMRELEMCLEEYTSYVQLQSNS